MSDSIAELKAALIAAKSELDAASRSFSSESGGLEAYLALHDKLMLAERRLAHAEGRPYAIKQDCSLEWDIGSPMPTLLQSEYKTFLLFLPRNDEDTIGLIEFEFCSGTSFGGPGDETYSGHPLFGSGFEGYTPLKVVNSRWIEEIKRIDSVHSRHEPSRFDQYNHFIFPFHDSTFECVARSFKTSKLPRPHMQAILDTARRLPADG